MKLSSYKDLLGVSNEETAADIEIARIREFKDHPFKVLDDDSMTDLVESIKANGVLTPVLVRKQEEGYEMVSGHRRLHAAKLAGLTAIPAIVRTLTEDEAVIAMVDSNLQREELLPSEKAFAYKMRLNAMKRQAGRPSKNNSSQLGTNLRSDEIMAQQSGDKGDEYLENRRRNRQVIISTDEKHYRLLKAKVKKSGLSQTLFLEKVIDDVAIVNVPQFVKLMRELKHQGNNLNQVAKKLNSGERIWNNEVKIELEMCMAIYKRTLNAITSAMAGEK